MCSHDTNSIIWCTMNMTTTATTHATSCNLQWMLDVEIELIRRNIVKSWKLFYAQSGLTFWYVVFATRRITSAHAHGQWPTVIHYDIFWIYDSLLWKYSSINLMGTDELKFHFRWNKLVKMISSFTLNTKLCFDINSISTATECLTICLPQMHALFELNFIEKQIYTEYNTEYNVHRK